MVSRFLTELPIKDLPQGPDRFLIEDIVGIGTKTTTFSALKDYLGITSPGGLNNLGTEAGNVAIGNTTGVTGITGTTINVIASDTINLNPTTGRTTNINTGAGAVTTTLGNNTASNSLVINSRSVTAPNQVVNSDGSVITRSTGDSRYGVQADFVLTSQSNTITVLDTYLTLGNISLDGNSSYEINGILFLRKDNLDSEDVTSAVRLQYSGNINSLSTTHNTANGSQFNFSVYNNTVIPSRLVSINSTVAEDHTYEIRGVIRTISSGTLTVQFGLIGTASGSVFARPGTYFVARKL